MMPVLFFLFAGLGVYIATLPGAGDGYRYIFTLDPVGLADPKLWIYAFGQAFFSLSVAGNGTVIYGSYFRTTSRSPPPRAMWRCSIRWRRCWRRSSSFPRWRQAARTFPTAARD